MKTKKINIFNLPPQQHSEVNNQYYQQCHLATNTIQGRGKVNKQTNTSKWGKWTNQQLENAMNVMERGHTFLRKIVKYWNIPLNSLLDHLNGRTRCRKVGPQSVLIEEEDEVMVTWVLNMQNVDYLSPFNN